MAPQKFVALFYCYSNTDDALCDLLDTHLDPLRRKGWIKPWREKNVPPGEDREHMIKSHLREAQVILFLLISVERSKDQGESTIYDHF